MGTPRIRKMKKEINKIALNISIILFQIFPRFQTHFLPGDTIRCTSGGITGNKEKSVILQDFFFGQIIPCFFFPFCSLLLLLLFRNSFFSFHCFPKGSLPSAFSWGVQYDIRYIIMKRYIFQNFSPMVQCLPSFITPLRKESF